MLIASILTILLLWSTSSSGVKGAQDLAANTSPGDQLESWHKLAYSLFINGNRSYENEYIDQLTDLAELENILKKSEFNQDALINNRRTARQYYVINIYSSYWRILVSTTSLARRRKSLSENLLNIFSIIDSGCMKSDTDNISYINRLFDWGSGIKQALSVMKHSYTENCIERLFIAIYNPLRLLGTDDVIRVQELELQFGEDSESVSSSPSTAPKLALYIQNLDHPDMETLNPLDKTTASVTLGDIYSNEILEPCSKICQLGRHIDTVMPIVTDLFNEIHFKRPHIDDREKELENVEKTIQFACHITKMKYELIVNRLLLHFKRLKYLGHV